MDNYLLIGNGLNRCLSGSISWGKLLEDIASEYGVSYNPNIVMPLEFERIINEYLEKETELVDPGEVMNQIKKKVADKMVNVQLPDWAIHNDLKGLSINGILTTNYDSLLEKIFDKSYQYNGTYSAKYLSDSTATINNKAFYHIHGIAECIKSICLGYEHYMGVVSNLRAELNTRQNGIEREMHIKRILYGDEPARNSWGELFYTSNIAILGLGLTECESDLWWLITHRAYIYYSNYCNLRSEDILKNRIVYYDILDEEKRKNREEETRRKSIEFAQKNRHMLLKNEHIEVRTFSIGKDCSSYEEAYKLIIQDIKKKGI